MLTKLRTRLIDDVHGAWRLWSVRLGLSAITLESILLAAPDALLHAFNALPPAMQALLPEGLVRALPLILMIAATIARLIKQVPPEGDTA
jgi:hypothetical protein